MSDSDRPRVLIVDDEPDDQRALLEELRRHVEVNTVTPEDLQRENLREVDLVLVDLRLDYWPSREAVSSIALKPLNGLALAATLRGHANEVNSRRPIALALYSAHLIDISAGLPPEPREHILARANNLEWVFPKVQGDEDKPLSQRIASLASAVRELPSTWPGGDTDETRATVNQLLALDETSDWTLRAWDDVDSCHPPLHDLSEGSHGLAFLRWFLYCILPYPCFLWDTYHLAARLRLSLEFLEEELREGGAITQALLPFKYKGILSDFLGPRWWRSGIEFFLWNATNSASFDPGSVHKVLEELSGHSVARSDFIHPIICLDEDFRSEPPACSIEHAVRIRPDDWPPYADQAWARLELALENPRVRALVIDEDRDKLVGSPGQVEGDH